MKIIQITNLSLLPFNQLQEESVVTMGNFDGMHLGHQKIIQRLKEISSKLQLPSVVITYDPNPNLVLGKNKDLKLLLTLDEKISIFKKWEIDYLFIFSFNKEFYSITAKEFLESILLKIIHSKYIIIGFNHYFGKNREGNFDYLKKYFMNQSFSIEKVEPKLLEKTQVSSSIIRTYLVQGDLKNANLLLGYNYSLNGIVQKGFERGKKLGYPTANLKISSEKLTPNIGVYAGHCYYQNQIYKCMINIGNNPTFGNTEISIEVFILDFSKEIYSDPLTIEFIYKLRDEIKFLSIDELKNQLKIDEKNTKELIQL